MSFRTILVVDDEEPLRRSLRRILDRAGYIVLTAEDGSEAMRMYNAADPPVDLVLTDVVMQRMDGPELARTLWAIRPDLPIVFMSGLVQLSTLLAAGVPADADFLRKPYTIEEVLEIVEEALNRSR
jgi:DNA-binding NtrC family response regulator